MLVTQRVFAGLYRVLFAPVHAQIDSGAAVHLGAVRGVTRSAFLRLGGVPVKRKGRHIEYFLEFLLVYRVFARVVRKFVQHEQIASETEFMLFERNFDNRNVCADTKIAFAVFFYSVMNARVRFAVRNDKFFCVVVHFPLSLKIYCR